MVYQRELDTLSIVQETLFRIGHSDQKPLS